MKNREKIRIIKLILIILGISLCGCIIFISFLFRNRNVKIKQVSFKIENPKKIKPLNEEVMAAALEENPIHFNEWQERNKDVYAFIEIEGTPIAYPILRSNEKEEDYYLESTIDNQLSLPGSIYTQMINDSEFKDYVTVVYGHDMLDGTYFGCLREYVNKEYFEKNHKIMIYLPEERLEYHILGEAVIDDRLIPAFYSVKTIEGRDEFFEYAKETKEVDNQWVEDTSLTQEDKLLVLATCIGPRPENRRIIIAKLVSRHPVKPRVS